MKLKKHHRLIIAADGGAASGKTTGAKKISRKYGLKFLSSGLLYRFASYQLLKHKPKNNKNGINLKPIHTSIKNQQDLHHSKSKTHIHL